MYSDIVATEGKGSAAKTFELPNKAKQGGKGGKGWKGKGMRIGQGLADMTHMQAPTKLREELAKDELERVLRDDAPQEAYRRRQGEVKTTLHWNERKVLLSEAEFLTKEAGTDKVTVIYVGAAHGTHIPILSKMFPAISFILIGPEQPACQESRRIKIILSEPSLQLLTELNNKFCSTASKLLFICKMKPTNPDSDACTSTDLTTQQDMLKALGSVSAALLKFRLPYSNGTSSYPKGRITFPVWGGQTSTEARIQPDIPLRCVRYDHKKHEEQMFYFNTVTRLKTYPRYCPSHTEHSSHVFAMQGTGYDWRYDCSAEIDILYNYVKLTGAKYFEMIANEREKERRRVMKAKEERDVEKGRKRPREEAHEERTTDPLAHLIIKRAEDLEDSERALLISKLSDELSKELSCGNYTLETHPLTHLHEPRSKEQPFNQKLKPKVGGGSLVQAMPQAAPVQPVKEQVEQEAPQKAKPVDAMLSSIGVDLGDLSDSDSESSVEDVKPPKRARVEEVTEDHIQATSNKALEGYIKSLSTKPAPAVPENQKTATKPKGRTPSPPRQRQSRSRFGRGGSDDS
eukprot:TRINITY_DN16315_c0_g2_i1.p1 TRINITY_DN16315_c0_g2~~TRINITY_DN16315_c0_g2_i1.p1  ORF type:complete len:573 (+),score=168.28 TRINITY_DN16315_c0_g2_i1:62-1780(+)